MRCDIRLVRFSIVFFSLSLSLLRVGSPADPPASRPCVLFIDLQPPKGAGGRCRGKEQARCTRVLVAGAFSLSSTLSLWPLPAWALSPLLRSASGAPTFFFPLCSVLRRIKAEAKRKRERERARCGAGVVFRVPHASLSFFLFPFILSLLHTHTHTHTYTHIRTFAVTVSVSSWPPPVRCYCCLLLLPSLHSRWCGRHRAL